MRQKIKTTKIYGYNYVLLWVT